jgi:hypothetical protein
MDDSLEERVQDLEQLVLRLGERIDMLEAQLDGMSRLAIRTANRSLQTDGDTETA